MSNDLGRAFYREAEGLRTREVCASASLHANTFVAWQFSPAARAPPAGHVVPLVFPDPGTNPLDILSGDPGAAPHGAVYLNPITGDNPTVRRVDSLMCQGTSTRFGMDKPRDAAQRPAQVCRA